MNSTAVVSRLSSALASHASTAAAVPTKGAEGLPSADTMFTNSKECWVLPSNHPLMIHRISGEVDVSDNNDDGDDDNDDDDDDDNNDDDEDESCGTVSDYSAEEIPVWIKGEQRFISGVTDETTCGDLVEALLQQENLASESETVQLKDYCITERWRQVEQILDGKTKIWQIWSAWGKAQPEVKFVLRRVDGSHGLSKASASNVKSTGAGCLGVAGWDKDSGRGSPTGSINSAIVRRKRHRAQKSSFAWMTHGATIHPKSSKNSIERLMKLILEQGDIIQQQLTKLRDREMQINKIEEDRHRVREREHGKNYLLETYLKGLSEATELDLNTADSGITSEATTAASPEMEVSRDVESPPAATTEKDSAVKEQIKMLEKIVQLNKQIVKEEETAVKLFDRIRRYEMNIPNQSPEQLEENLKKVNRNIEKSQSELQIIDETLKHSDIALREKNYLLKSLQEELDAEESAANVIMDFSMPNPTLSVSRASPASMEGSGESTIQKKPNDDNYPMFVNNDQRSRPEISQNAHTLPRNQRFPVTAQSAIPSISVHQINKFIQSNNKLGTNCNTMLDNKICPKQLFNSALCSQSSSNPTQDVWRKPHESDDISNVGTLV
ncbi:ras association domain-containing protein 10 [Malaya genurostris]|uniref:ras association domain-containing protein 10 n=1 Tax=Malaya genurostris TaxID=325434 RepID=UPI0026F38DAD|nr:ras association domain-containing protein 10 [Malaya genurostris]